LKRVTYAELSIVPLCAGKCGRLKFKELPKFPSVSRDLALVVDQKTGVGDIVKAAKNSGAKILENVEVFDIYEGEHVEEGKKSVALTLTYQTDHTLTEDEINTAHNKVLDNLKKRVKAELRA
jgi:phenylalanyl-tRNA synthetase beta chain